MARHDDDDDDDDDDDTPPPYKDESDREEGGQAAFQFVRLGQIFGNSNPAAEEAEKKVTNMLGGPSAVKAFTDQLRPKLKKQYIPRNFIERLMEFRTAVTPEVFAALAAGPNLQGVVDSYEADRVSLLITYAANAVLDHLDRRDQIPMPTRHEVEYWVRANVCFCGRCWED